MTTKKSDPVAPLPGGEDTPDQSERTLNVFQAVNAVMGSVSVITKDRRGPDKQGGFAYRGIEDVMNVLHPLLSSYGVLIVPVVVDHRMDDASYGVRATIKVDFHVYGPTGDRFIGTVVADGIDGADKAYGKALSYAWKSFVLQLFVIPTAELLDNEAGVEIDPWWHTYGWSSQQEHDDARKSLMQGSKDLPDDLKEELKTWATSKIDGKSGLTLMNKGYFAGMISRAVADDWAAKVVELEFSDARSDGDPSPGEQ